MGFKLSIANSRFFVSNKNKREKERKLERINKEETVKMMILTRLHQELTLDKTLKAKEKHTKSITISVNAKYKDIIFDTYDAKGNIVERSIFTHTEFSPYQIEQVKECNDIREAYPGMPFMFKCSLKKI